MPSSALSSYNSVKNYVRALKFAAKAGKQIGSSIRNYYTGSNGKTSSGKKAKSGTNTNYTTVQHDTSTVYRKRRMPGKKRRRWRKFARRVRAVSDYMVGLKTVLFNDSTTVTFASGYQKNYSIHLYGSAGTNVAGREDGARDLSQIFSADTLSGASSRSDVKLFFKSAVLDATFTNLATSVVELDIYEIMYFKTCNQTSLYLSIAAAETDTAAIGAQPGLSIINRGATPFDFPLLIKDNGMKILKKTKFYLGTGNAVNYQIRMPGNKVLSNNDIKDLSSFQQPKLTRTLLCIAKCVDPAYVGDGIRVGVTRKYAYKALTNTVNVPYDALIPS